MREPWPDRRLLNRILNVLRRLKTHRKKHADSQGEKDHLSLAR